MCQVWSLQVSAPTVRYAGIVANLTGNPAMSVPLWWNDDGLPIGVQLVAPPWREDIALAGARIVEAASGGWQSPGI